MGAGLASSLSQLTGSGKVSSERATLTPNSTIGEACQRVANEGVQPNMEAKGPKMPARRGQGTMAFLSRGGVRKEPVLGPPRQEVRGAPADATEAFCGADLGRQQKLLDSALFGVFESINP